MLDRTSRSWLIALTIMLASWVGSSEATAQFQMYHPDPSMARDPRVGETLKVSPTLKIRFRWVGTKSVYFHVYARATVNAPWVFAIKEETTSFFVSAVAPRYYDKLYVCGVSGSSTNPTTTIEEWTPVVGLTPTGDITFQVTRNLVLVSPNLTHIEACAADPAGEFLIAKHKESSKVWRIDLSDGSKQVIASLSDSVNLNRYNIISYKKHSVDGHVFELIAGRNAGEPPVESGLLLWDSNIDGYPELIEELSTAGYQQRGYHIQSGWLPDSKFDE